MQAYAEQILTARKRLGLSRAAAAIKLGVSPRQLARYEQGESPIPLTLVVSLAEALGTSIDAVIGRDLPVDLTGELNGRRFMLSAADPPGAGQTPAVDPHIAEAVQLVQAAAAARPRRSKRSGSRPPSA
jgi:transcriptional regulator with XRE-family HTH domain